MQQLKQKENKMIQLLLAIKNKGINIDEIYNKDVLAVENKQQN